MRRLLLLLCLSAIASAAEHDEPQVVRAFVAAEAPRAEVFAGERIRIRLVFGYDPAFFRDHLVPLFHRRMDRSVQVDAPWFDGVPGLAALPAQMENDAAGESFVLNDQVVEAVRGEDRLVNGAPYTVLVVNRDFSAVSPGVTELPAPSLRLAWATRFTEDFISGRRPLDRRETVLSGVPLTITVRDLPEEGRPPGFTGAVGRFTVSAESLSSEMEAGESFRLVLTIDGEGNHGRFDPPDLSELPGFHVYGSIDDRESVPRTVAYDLVATDRTVGAVPPIAFVFFDPSSPAGYRSALTAAIPIVVRGARGGTAAAPEDRSGGSDPVFESTSLVPAAFLALCSLIALGAVLLIRRRRRMRERADPREQRAREAGIACRERLELAECDPAEVFSEYLAARLDCTAAAVIAPKLGARLLVAGVPSDLAERTAGLMERLTAARYGRGGGGGDRDEVSALVGELEDAFGGPCPGDGA